MGTPLDRDAFVWAMGALCALHRIPFDSQLLLRRFPPPYDVNVLQQALIAYEFKVALQTSALKDIHPAALPALAIFHPLLNPGPIDQVDKPIATNLDASVLADANTQSEISQLYGSQSSDALEPSQQLSYRLALVLKADQERVLILESADATPTTLLFAEFNSAATGQMLFVTKKEQALNDDGSEAKPNEKSASQKFGFRWFIPELLKHKKIWREILLASFAIQLVALATPLCTQVIIDKVVVHHTVSTLIVIAVAMGIFLIFNAAMGWIRQYLVLHTGNRMDAVLGNKVFNHLMHLPMRYFEHRATGVLIARLQGVETIRQFLAGSLITLILDCPFLIVFLGIMLFYSWQLTMISLASLALIAILSFIVTPIFRTKLNHQFLLGARNQAFLTEYVAGMETVKSLQLEPQLDKRYGGFLATYLTSAFGAKQLANTYNTVANTLDQLQTTAILCVGAWIVMHDPEFTIGMLVAFQMFSSRLSGPVLRLVGMWQEFQQADIAVKRLGDVMDAPTEPYSLVPSRTNQQAGYIELENISFRYSEHHPWLYKDLSLTIKPNKCTVIMGPSGCGKSTLAKLLLGFVQPQEGNIKLDGRDIRHLSANELRNAFGMVPQETLLFAGTLYDNFTLANPHVSFEQIVHACQLAGIHETIDKLPQAYQTEIGEHGTGLSGGQKQRIAIARALLRQPSILIFDEAVSSLDQHTAEQFAQTVNMLKGKVTILFITHHLPKGLNVDEAILLGKEISSPTNQQDEKFS